MGSRLRPASSGCRHVPCRGVQDDDRPAWRTWVFALLAAGFALSVVASATGHRPLAGLVALARDLRLGFLWTSTWDPVAGAVRRAAVHLRHAGLSLLALLIAVPHRRRRRHLPLRARSRTGSPIPLAFLTELLAAIPSVVYGLWGIFVLVPLVRNARALLAPHWVRHPALLRAAATASACSPPALILAVMIVPFTRRSPARSCTPCRRRSARRR